MLKQCKQASKEIQIENVKVVFLPGNDLFVKWSGVWQSCHASCSPAIASRLAFKRLAQGYFSTGSKPIYYLSHGFSYIVVFSVSVIRTNRPQH